MTLQTALRIDASAPPRPNLPPLPPRIGRLPVDHRGFPVPWFVQWYDRGRISEPGVGTPDFRVIDTSKMAVAVRQRRCWICGQPTGRNLAFTIGPMCAVNRVTSEPPAHFECAEFSAKACPFLTQPRMRRNEKGLPEQRTDAAGIHIDRNPGAVCVWVTRLYTPFKPEVGAPGTLFKIGDPERVLWFAHGRAATRTEVKASIDSGFPLLLKAAELQGAEAVSDLYQQLEEALPLLPAEVPA